MFPKEKAKELVNKFKKHAESYCSMSSGLERLSIANTILMNSKQCAKICVKEIITELNSIESKDLSDLQFWNEVDYEIDSIQNID
ncbi:hypothetical protein Phi13:2_gp066 [Cellulophaga phage phi13:2]|uniref:Uncharacterized protein n=1 Tax=Cellulophaga phage phi13:2 TaxID=1328030 RepID=S0A2P0_9CAUD|nr:hypothetical protein Phi13:2_gp066 [Cellulophaga phage phi13:2]AGO49676.1 hypothetical protein Phi13:2_gp066 [Cellulophaga phage phi13:2]